MFSGTRPAGTAFTSTPSAPKITWNGLLTVEWLSGLMKKARAPWSQESAEEEARATANPASDATVTETARRIGLLSFDGRKACAMSKKRKRGQARFTVKKGQGRFTRDLPENRAWLLFRSAAAARSDKDRPVCCA